MSSAVDWFGLRGSRGYIGACALLATRLNSPVVNEVAPSGINALGKPTSLKKGKTRIDERFFLLLMGMP